MRPVFGEYYRFAILDVYNQAGDNKPGTKLPVKKCCICTLISGSIVVAKPYEFTIPKEGTFTDKVDFVTLQSAGKTICISKLHESVKNVVKALEEYIANKYANLPDAKSDIFIRGEIDMEKPE